MPSQVASQLRATIAANIDSAITAKHLTNRQVADAIGSTEHQVWRWRRGKVTPIADTLAALADTLGQDMAWFYIEAENEAA